MKLSVFDVAGPIMVGPSSSHTAGACKIGQIARALFHGTPNQVDFYLYGSFATVYKGHATDRALLAGVMKLKTSDGKMKDAFAIAKKKKLKYNFEPIKDKAEEHHPNTVRIILKNTKRNLSVVGSSLGGGVIKITHINNVPVDLEMMSGRYFSLIIGHKNDPKTLQPLLEKLEEWNIPVRDMQTLSVKKKSITALNIEDEFLKLPQVLELEKIKDIEFVRSLTKLLK